MGRLSKDSPHYVNNKEFLIAMIEYKRQVNDAISNNGEKPVVSDYIASCFMKITNRLSYRPNFINYTFKDDMVSDGIENCLLYADRFDETKSSNPFAYFTQIIWNAFLRRIIKEKKQTQIRYQMLNEYFPDDNEIRRMLPGDKWEVYLKMTAPDEKKKKKKIKKRIKRRKDGGNNNLLFNSFNSQDFPYRSVG